MKVVLSYENVEEPATETDGVRTILVRDSFGNPIFLAMQQTEDSIWAVTPGDPKFNDYIEQLGVSKRITVKKSSLGG